MAIRQDGTLDSGADNVQNVGVQSVREEGDERLQVTGTGGRLSIGAMRVHYLHLQDKTYDEDLGRDVPVRPRAQGCPICTSGLAGAYEPMEGEAEAEQKALAESARADEAEASTPARGAGDGGENPVLWT